MVPLFLMVFYGLYFSGIASILLATVVGHLSLEVVFLAAGVLFTFAADFTGFVAATSVASWTAAGHVHRDAVARVLRSNRDDGDHPARRLLRPGAAWNIDAVADQRIAGALAWSYGELPSLTIVLILLFAWASDDTRRAEAADRRKDAEGDVELEAYNAWLCRLNRR